ncbi:methyltransferase domain-containing protein [Saccharothrix variisporea]|uniref:Methyltransferase family protein n=1 Tax=Saccharothrix variisporea TaxID=543527 RepID=A0A495X3K0_9PSEU|nr:class I SAM-dependent methyltransferase [Saccharothrix variisporea]RKT68116.1 methyltransferase family protein [Saccharothrix variisporea]
MTGFAPEWLALREDADAEARSGELADRARDLLAVNREPLVIRDLGCGTGSMGRWLSARLGGPQHWVLHDRDPRLLELAGASLSGVTVGTSGVTVETRLGDLTALGAADLAGASLVTASALLDLLTRDQVNSLAAACVEAGVPALFTLSVAGRVELDPADPLDARLQDAFNAHQRRDGLLGPDAPAVAVEAFEGLGARVETRPSPWRLRPGALVREWMRGWVEAACEQEPGLAGEADGYLRRRESARAVVHHVDLLAVP